MNYGLFILSPSGHLSWFQELEIMNKANILQLCTGFMDKSFQLLWVNSKGTIVAGLPGKNIFIFLKTATVSSQVAVPLCIPTGRDRVPVASHSHHRLLLLVFRTLVILASVWWLLIANLIYAFLPHDV